MSKQYLTEMEHIEKIWAENGVVKVQGKDGRVRNMTPRDAIIRANSINEMSKSMPQWHKARIASLVEKTMQAVLLAKKQCGEDRKAAAVMNAPKGLKADGTPLPVNRIEEALIANMRTTCPTLSEDEIAYVVRGFPEVPLPDKMKKLELVHKARSGALKMPDQAAPAVP